MKYYKPTPDSKDGTGGDYSKWHLKK
jgi:hypothetical protein